jgi:hypothetical protein
MGKQNIGASVLDRQQNNVRPPKQPNPENRKQSHVAKRVEEEKQLKSHMPEEPQPSPDAMCTSREQLYREKNSIKDENEM